MRLVVTGAAGFLGRQVCRAVVARGDEVLGLVRPGERPPGDLDAATFAELDEYGVSDLEHAIRRHGADAIVHCAGATPRTGGDLASLYDANVQLVWRLLLAAADVARPCRVVLVSSAAVYGLGVDGLLEETARPAPQGHYGWSKVAAESVASAFKRQGEISSCIARPFNMLGPGEPAGSIVRDVVSQLSTDSISVRETTSVRDYIDVRDVASALLFLAEHGHSGEAYNVCTGIGTSVGQLVGAIQDVWGTSASLTARDPATAATRAVGSPEKLNELGWVARHSVRDALEALRESE